eukprot:3442365-Prymnesium_polylepis.1
MLSVKGSCCLNKQTHVSQKPPHRAASWMTSSSPQKKQQSTVAIKTCRVVLTARLYSSMRDFGYFELFDGSRADLASILRETGH